MARGQSQQRRAKREVAILATAVLLASLCVPAVLLAQDAAPPTEQGPEIGAPPAEPATPPTPPAGPPSDGEPVQPAEPTPPPEASAPPPPAAAATPLAVASGASTVTMADFSFSPATATVNQGDTVTWTNAGPDEPHTATGNGFDTGQVGVGSSGSATFAQAGTFEYVCTLHPDLMSGTVTVVAAGATDDQGGEADPDTVAPTSEAAAVAASDAAGTASKLPATGLVALPLAAIGLALLALGARLRNR